MIQGSCHCGAVQWRFDGVPEGATACNCTVCRRYGVLWAYDFEDEGITVWARRKTCHEMDDVSPTIGSKSSWAFATVGGRDRETMVYRASGS
jgi:hypothetical protein